MAFTDETTVSAHMKIWWQSLPALLVGAAIVALLIASVMIVKPIVGEPLPFFTREPAYIAKLNPWAGLLSNAGILIWTGAAFFSFLAAALAPRSRAFFVASGLLSSVLVIDDMFMLHDVVFPDYLGVNQLLIYLVYILMLLVYLFAYRRRLMNNDYPILFVALVCFSLSVLADVFAPRDFRFRVLFEDGFKLAGICCWTIYFWVRSVREIRESNLAGLQS